eukprot:16428888-Heterocapsa_arctica.AAC.1
MFAGVRLERTVAMLGSPTFLFSVKVVLVVGEASKRFAYYFQDAAEGRLRNDRPFLADLALQEASPVRAVQQYMAALMDGSAPALRLIWQHRGHTSPQQWAAACPGEARTLQRAVAMVAALLHRRHGHLAKAPFTFASLADSRSTAAHRAAVVKEFNDCPACCHRPGLAQQLRERS